MAFRQQGSPVVSSLRHFLTFVSVTLSKEMLLKLPKRKLKSVGERSFCFLTPSVWNSLPSDLWICLLCLTSSPSVKISFSSKLFFVCTQCYFSGSASCTVFVEGWKPEVCALACVFIFFSFFNIVVDRCCVNVQSAVSSFLVENSVINTNNSVLLFFDRSVYMFLAWTLVISVFNFL